MKNLFICLFIFAFTFTLSAQEVLYTDSKLKIEYTVEQKTDRVNDDFYDYYAIKITNLSQEQVSFIPIFNYTTESGDQRNSENHDDTKLINLAPGESVTGNQVDRWDLVLFKEFTVGNSGKKAGDATYTLTSAIIKYQ